MPTAYPNPARSGELPALAALAGWLAACFPARWQARFLRRAAREMALARVFAATAVVLGLAAPSSGAELAPPTGEVLLTVQGDIRHTNAQGRAQFDLAMLKALGVERFATSTIWTDGVSVYEGVPLRAVLQAVGAHGEMITLTAINDYSVTFPSAEVSEGVPILAFRRDGTPMSIRDKGPIWLVYPYDSSPAYRTEQVYSRSVWQLDRLRLHD